MSDPRGAQIYEPDGATLERYLRSVARVRLMQGPRGSGKSSASSVALMMNAQMQAPSSADGVRRTRFYAVRNTFDELQRTTLQTWRGLFPETVYGPVKGTRPMVHNIRVRDIEMEVIFLAMDDPEDVRKLLSAEATGIWLNEFRELPRKVLDEVDAVIGRYPNKQMAPGGCSRPMLVGDTNAPDENHWFAMLSGQVPIPPNTGEDERRRLIKPDTWEIFLQPPAMLEVKDAEGNVSGHVMNPAAENVRWLPDGYYELMVKGKDKTWIGVNVLNRPGTDRKGQPVHPQFRRDRHVAKNLLAAVPGHPIMIGVDFGRTPAAALGQRVFERWRILRELTTRNMGAKEFAGILKRLLAEEYPGFSYSIWGDPAGEHLAEADDISPFLMFRAAGLRIMPAPTNDPTIRRAALDELLTSSVDGAERFMVSPNCTLLISALDGGFRFEDTRGAEGVMKPAPVKDFYSHVAEACEYLMVGGGEGRALLGRSVGAPDGGVARPRVVRRPQSSVFDRWRARR